jgi:hypothetical protein
MNLKQFLKLPMRERRKLLKKQADNFAPYYEGIDAGNKWEWRRRKQPETPRPKCPFRLPSRMRMWKEGFNQGAEYVGWV